MVREIRGNRNWIEEENLEISENTKEHENKKWIKKGAKNKEKNYARS